MSILEQIRSKYGQDVMPMYKAEPPFAEFTEGFGYRGIVLTDTVEGVIQCHICGEWFKSLGPHLNRIHKKTSKDYREEVGLNRTTPLTSEELRLKQQAIGIERYKKYKNRIIEGNKKYFKSHRRKGYLKKGCKRIQHSNYHATCDLQLKDRFDSLTKQLKRVPLRDECPFSATLCRRFGNYSNAVAAFGLKPLRRFKHHTKKELILCLREYRKLYGRKPYSSDFVKNKMFPDPATYLRRFGSWSKAKKIAFK